MKNTIPYRMIDSLNTELIASNPITPNRRDISRVCYPSSPGVTTGFIVKVYGHPKLDASKEDVYYWYSRKELSDAVKKYEEKGDILNK